SNRCASASRRAAAGWRSTPRRPAAPSSTPRCPASSRARRGSRANAKEPSAVAGPPSARCAPRGGGLLLALAAVAVAEALLELLDAALGVDEALLARVERVVAGPDVDVQLGLRAVGLHDDLAVTDDLGLDHLGVYALLHACRSLSRPGCS